MYDDSCVFCREIIKKRNAAFVYEDDDVVAFMDNAPIDNGHILVIPREHYQDIFSIDNDLYIKIYKTVKKLAPVLISSLNAQGLNISQNNGRAANQVVMHYHVHMIPRYNNSKLNMERHITDIKELEKTAVKIRAGVLNEES
ncbi:HIT family protein [Picrophilus oshimae]|uniref:Asymmetrical bis(5'-nucleosyl)-tetraphosphatase n=1 Tax=Picrophilus torridus (strain ATCC 700027 / DSM 9790 / JCM 10055 / NBRC 100828 / KAW 2/3) TaxID=1122961 RepID=Q6L1V3_PICTO|nr:HIT domain-containing protein [Picrophilus oshimae]AAT43049.1 asymmetrical bis(5'-nucleosyl)-tetraphosphatase [Picrophilus oshimae DSM 9789]SMD30644.1 bis(5'-nucleosidyl)-tetraphosphatase [Picrophilus oshimae DSM 9789]